MTDSPVPFRSRMPRRRLRGYDCADVDHLLEDLGRSYSQLCAERDELNARLEKAQEDLSRYAELERALRESIITAQKAADDLAERSAREAEATLEKARSAADELLEKARTTQERLEVEAGRKAGEILRTAREDHARLKTEVAELELLKKELHASTRAFLRAALDVVEQGEWRLDPRSADSRSQDEEASPRAPDPELTKPPRAPAPAASASACEP
jgi:cell division initiation protein